MNPVNVGAVRRGWSFANALGIVALVALSSCQKPLPTTPSGTSYVITISATGLSPATIDVPLGSRVLFVNHDTRSHYMHSDPHPDATDCPALNQVGLLEPAQQRESGNLVEVRTCGYHDHDIPSNANYKGRITIK